MTRPMPIHYPGRDLRTEPHESEPTHGSYDPSTYDAAHNSNNPLLWEDAEDQFHQRLARRSGGNSNGGGTSNSGNSFWRTSRGLGSNNTNNNNAALSTPRNNNNNAPTSNDNPTPMTPTFSSMSLHTGSGPSLGGGGGGGLLGAALQSHNSQHYMDTVRPLEPHFCKML